MSEQINNTNGPAAGKGAFGGCGEHLPRRFGPELPARRDLPLRRRPNARAARCRREAKRPAQHGGDVALRRGGFHEAPDTQQRPALRLRDAEVDRLRRVAREGVDDGAAERGVVVGNLSECYHNDWIFWWICTGAELPGSVVGCGAGGRRVGYPGLGTAKCRISRIAGVSDGADGKCPADSRCCRQSVDKPSIKC